jgi:hypothetical protein
MKNIGRKMRRNTVAFKDAPDRENSPWMKIPGILIWHSGCTEAPFPVSGYCGTGWRVSKVALTAISEMKTLKE